jgi:hypothetical protein
MTTSFRDPWFTDRRRSDPTTQVCNQPLRLASLAGRPPQLTAEPQSGGRIQTILTRGPDLDAIARRGGIPGIAHAALAVDSPSWRDSHGLDPTGTAGGGREPVGERDDEVAEFIGSLDDKGPVE